MAEGAVMTKGNMSPIELRYYINDRTRNYLAWLRQKCNLPIPDDETVSHPRWRFVFTPEFRCLNFHPDIRSQVEDLISGKVERKYDDAASEIAVHDFIGHMASSQALCWNLVLPMKKHDNFAPLFDVLRDSLREYGLHTKFDFGIETAAVLELNVGRDLGEKRRATSIDLYLRTAQGKVCTIEFKFTEAGLGQCRQPKLGNCDGSYGSPQYIQRNKGYLCYLAKVGTRYWHLGAQYGLLDPTKVASSQADAIQQCPLNIFYQALRNLMVAKKRSGEDPDGETRGILVLATDERNSAFWGPGNSFDRLKSYLTEARGKERPDVFRISVQDIAKRFTGTLSSYKEFLAVKYGFPSL
jgi:hypothetical protein